MMNTYLRSRLPEKHTTENERLHSLVEKLGEEYAISFAKQTYALYKRGLLSKKFVFVQDKFYRKKFIESCLSFREYLRKSVDIK